MGRENLVLEAAGCAVPLRVERSKRARHLSLRIDAAAGDTVLVLPPGVALSQGLDFVRLKSHWLLDRYASLPPRVPFAAGVEIPLLGVQHLVRHAANWRGTVRRHIQRGHGPVLDIGGEAEHLPRRLADWLRAEARRQIAPRVSAKAAKIERQAARLTIRDTRSRWGSCSPDARLSFSWRLIMAPLPVLDYVVAHEVAHLVHLNHGPEFWRVVDKLTGNVAGGRDWLRTNGASLLRYG